MEGEERGDICSKTAATSGITSHCLSPSLPFPSCQTVLSALASAAAADCAVLSTRTHIALCEIIAGIAKPPGPGDAGRSPLMDGHKARTGAVGSAVNAFVVSQSRLLALTAARYAAGRLKRRSVARRREVDAEMRVGRVILVRWEAKSVRKERAGGGGGGGKRREAAG